MLALPTSLKRVECLAFTPDGEFVLAGGQGLELWDVRRLELVWRSCPDWGYFRAVAVTPDGDTFVATADDFGTVTGSTRTGSAGRCDLGGLAWFPPLAPGSRLGVVGGRGSLACWSAWPAVAGRKALAPTTTWMRTETGVDFRGAAFLLGGPLITHEVVTGGTRPGPRFAARDPQTGEILWTARCSYHQLDALAAAPDGTQLVAIRENKLIVWEPAILSRPPRVETAGGTLKRFTDVAFHPSGLYLATAGNDHVVTLWDAAAWRPAREFEWHAGRMRSVAFAPDGLSAAAGGEQGQLVLFDVDV